MNTLKIVFANLFKAISAEEKQGFADTGALGGFHAFLGGVVPRLAQLLPERDFALLRQIAGRYPQLSPLQRREAVRLLKRELEDCRSISHDEFPEALISQEVLSPAKIGGNVSPDEGQELSKDRGGKKSAKPAQSAVAPEPFPLEGGGRNPGEERGRIPEQQALLSPKPDFTGRAGFSRPGAPGQPELRGNPSPEDSASGSPRLEQRSATPLQYIKGVGPERVKQLRALGIETVKDMLLYYPRRYEDRSLRSIAELQDGELATLEGVIVSGQIHQAKIKVVKLAVEQNGRLIQAVWFNQPYILKQYPAGTRVVVTGKVRRQRNLLEIQVSDIEKSKNLDSTEQTSEQTSILPVYSETARLSSKVLRGVVQQVLSWADRIFPEFLPPSEQGGWMERGAAYREIHFPSSYEGLAKARERLVWEEILFLQLAVARLRNTSQKNTSPVLPGDEALLKAFFRLLPFGLTKAQARVIGEIKRDMAQAKGMARLVQGDVGSGKTVVAMAALLQCISSGYQGALMAPTEILALQHYQSLEGIFTSLGASVVVLLGSQARGEREDILARIGDGRAQVIIGTHALIQESVAFHSLGLAITDEQHRFGVRQRTLLHGKGESPHVLVLSATPIPRTLALTLYGDLQLSVIDEMPAGRKPVLTRRLSERGRPNLEKFMEEQINLGRQIYVVCPLVEDSESLDLVSAQERADYLAKRFSRRKVALLHGRQKGAEKEEIMRDFQAGAIDILVATTVVEVGVNVPNASLMVIEGADRFGLAQLHQLRGRVGRGSEQSYCILMSEARSSKRLDVLCQTQDGFKIAEEDLKLRGPGELLGTRQHGLPELRLADLSRDGVLVEKAYQFVQRVLDEPEQFKNILAEAELFYKPEKAGIN